MGRHLPALAALLLALSASSAGATTIPPVPDAGVAPEQRVAAGSGTVLTLRTADPERGQPPWTLRVSRSVTGLECSAVGQVEGAAFGLVGLDGAFRELPEVNADACARPGALIGTRVFAARRLRNVRTVVSGVAGPGLRRVTVEAGGRARTVPHSSEGAFVHVLRGYPEDAAPAVTLELSDGTRRKWAYASGKGFTVPDPLRRAGLEAAGVRLRDPATDAQAAARADGVHQLHDRARRPRRGQCGLAAGLRAPARAARHEAQAAVLHDAAPVRRRAGRRLPERGLEPASRAGRGLGQRARGEADRRPGPGPQPAHPPAAQRRLPRPASRAHGPGPGHGADRRPPLRPLARDRQAAGAGPRGGGRPRPPRGSPCRWTTRPSAGGSPTGATRRAWCITASTGQGSSPGWPTRRAAPAGRCRSSTPSASRSSARRARWPARGSSPATAACSSAASRGTRSAGSTATGASGARASRTSCSSARAASARAPRRGWPACSRSPTRPRRRSRARSCGASRPPAKR